MGIKVHADKSLVWDNESNQMVMRTAVSVSIVGINGTVYAIEGPIYCQTGHDIFEATTLLKNRIIGRLPRNEIN